MARVAVAYVEIRPDLEQFAELLRTELAKVQVAHSVKITPDVDKNAGQQIAKALKRGKGGGGLEDEVDEIGEFIGQELGQHISENFQVDDDTLSQHLKDAGRSMNNVMDLLGDEATEAFVKGMRRKLTKRMTDEMGKAFTHVEEEEKIQGRLMADVFADNFLDQLKDRNKEIGRAEAASIKKYFLKEFGTVGLSVADRMVNEFNRGLRQREAEIKREAERVAKEAARAAERATRDEARRVERASRDAARQATRAAADEVRRNSRRVEDESRRSGRRAGQAFADDFASQMRLGLNLRLGQVVPIVTAISVAAAPLAGILSSVAAGAVAMAAAFGEAAGATGLALVSTLLALAQAGVVARVATLGMSDALKAQAAIQTELVAGQKITQAQWDKYQRALAQLGPDTRNFVVQLGVLNDQFRQIRNNTAQRLFAGAAGQLKQLSNVYLPVLNSELGRTADMLNRAAGQFSTFLREAGTVRLIRDIMRENTDIAERYAHALVPLADTALRLLRAFAPLAKVMAGWVNDWAAAINRSVRANEASGELAETIQTLTRAMDRARSIVGHLWGALSGTFKALLRPGRLMLDMFDRLIGRWDDWVNSVAGQSAIFAWANDAIPILSSLGSLIGEVFTAFNRLAKAGVPKKFIDSVAGMIGPLTDFLVQLSASGAAEDFANAMSSLFRSLVEVNAGDALASIAANAALLLDVLARAVTYVTPLTVALGGLLRVLAFIAALKFALALTGLNRLPQYTLWVIDFGKALFGAKVNAEFMKTTSFRVATGMQLLAGWMLTAAKQTVAFIGVLGRAAFALATTRAGALGVAAALQAIRLAMVANPIGAIITGIALVATAIWALTRSSDTAEASLRRMNNELVKAGAGGVGTSVQNELDKLRGKIQLLKDQLKDPIMENLHGEEIRADLAKTEAEVNELAGAQFRLSKVYGSATQSIIDELRKRGVSEKTSDAEIVVAINRVHKAYGDQVVSAERMVNDLANIYGVWTDNTDAATTQVAGYVANAAASFANISQAAIDAATKSVMALAAIADASKSNEALYGGAGRLLGQQQAALNAINAAAAASGPKVSAPPFNYADSGFRDAASQIEKATTSAGSAAGKKTAAGFITSFDAELDRLLASDILGHSKGWINSGLGIAKYIAKGITSGADNILKVGRYIAKKFPQQLDRIRKLYAKYIAAATPFIKELRKNLNLDQLNELLTQIKDFKQKAFEALTPSRDLVGVFGFIPTPEETRNQLQAQLDSMRQFTKGIEALQAKGLSKELAAAWLQAGAETAGNLVQGLADATPAQIAEINKLYDTIGSEASKTADSQATQYYGIGQATVEGYIKGIASMQAAAVAEIQKILDAALAAAKKKLGIKSPSSVFDLLGVNTVAGYIQGVESKSDATVAAVNDLYSQVIDVPPPVLTPPSIRPGYATPGAFGSITQPTPVINVRVFVGDREIKDILNVEVERFDQTRARALLAGRRGG